MNSNVLSFRVSLANAHCTTKFQRFESFFIGIQDVPLEHPSLRNHKGKPMSRKDMHWSSHPECIFWFGYQRCTLKHSLGLWHIAFPVSKLFFPVNNLHALLGSRRVQIIYSRYDIAITIHSIVDSSGFSVTSSSTMADSTILSHSYNGGKKIVFPSPAHSFINDEFSKEIQLNDLTAATPARVEESAGLVVEVFQGEGADRGGRWTLMKAFPNGSNLRPFWADLHIWDMP